MKIRLNEDYYFWCCDWCDSENLVLWAKLESGTNCGACHKPMKLQEMNGVVVNSNIVNGLCYLLARPSKYTFFTSYPGFVRLMRYVQLEACSSALSVIGSEMPLSCQNICY